MNYKADFDKCLNKMSDVIEPLRDEEFVTACEETLNGEGVTLELSKDNDLSVISDKSGLYCFWIKLTEWHQNSFDEWEDLVKQFADEWERPVGEIQYSPKSNKGNRIKRLKDYEDDEWIPLYIGKSENVQKRVRQHIELAPEKKTYALKLKARSKQLEGAEIEVTSLELDTCKENYFVVGLIEQLVRARMCSIIGKQ